jgi:hypothetical protein
MNIRRKRVGNIKRQSPLGTCYEMWRDVGTRSYRNSVAFTETQMTHRGYVARRLVDARRELREFIQRERMA